MNMMTFEIHDMPEGIKTDKFYDASSYPTSGFYGPVLTSTGPQYFLVAKSLNGGYITGLPKSVLEDIQYHVKTKPAPVQKLQFLGVECFPPQQQVITARDMIIMAAVAQNPELVKYLGI